MSLAKEWKKEIADMSPMRTTLKDKVIDIKEKRKSSRTRYRSINKRQSSLLQDIIKSLNNNSYIAYIIVFCLFYLLGWFVIFSQIESAEHESLHKSPSSLLHPNGEITHHLPKQIQDQIQKLAQLESLHEAKDHLTNLASKTNDLIDKMSPDKIIQALSEKKLPKIEDVKTNDPNSIQSRINANTKVCNNM